MLSVGRVNKTGTRSIIAFQNDYNQALEMYYKHYDGYPTYTGKRIIEALKASEPLYYEDMVKTVLSAFDDCSNKPERARGWDGELYHKAEEVFPGYQADLEWIYIIGNARDTEGRRYLSIYATNWINPLIKASFVWRVWGSYTQLFDDNLTLGIDTEMRLVGQRTRSQVMMINAYHKATTTAENPSQLVQS